MPEQNDKSENRNESAVSTASTELADIVRNMDRIVSQQRRMSYFLMLLQEETGRDARLEGLEKELKRLENIMDEFCRKLAALETPETRSVPSSQPKNK
jgi:hypothetical protein